MSERGHGRPGSRTSKPTAVWQLPSSRIDLSAGVLMGIVNVTPDSFSDGGEFLEPDKAIAHGLRLVAEGAALIDVGGESTRPGARPVPAEIEKERVLPVVGGLVDAGVVVSIDSYKPEVASAALEAGAQIVNDVTGCRSAEMMRLVAESGCGVVVMHPRGALAGPLEGDLVSNVQASLLEATGALVEAGVDRRAIVVDPGIGFGKRREGNLELIAGLGRLSSLGFPVLLGVSRKRFLGEIVNSETPTDLDLATAVVTAAGFQRGARIFRVHDAASSRRALHMAWAIQEADQEQHAREDSLG